MNRPNSVFDSFALAPLSAGDIIDRAVRIYRQQFWRLLQIVIWPSLIAYTGVILYTFGLRNFALDRGDERIFLGVVMTGGGFLIYLLGKMAFYVVLGGTARSLVNYLLNHEPLKPRAVYQAVKERFWSLAGAVLLVGMIVMACIFFLYMLVVMCVMVYVLTVTWLMSSLPNWFQITSHVIFGALLALGIFLPGLMLFKRIVFIPQALMVEGKGIFDAIGRSFALAGGDIRQIGAIVLFDMWLTFSLLYLLLLPLGWYAWVRGISLFGSDVPLWYNIAYQTLSQVSEILLAPIAMLGFTLLYLDSRVRREGFDIELLASRQLALPSLPQVTPAPVVPSARRTLPYPTLGQDGPITKPQTASAGSSALANSIAEAGITSLFGPATTDVVRNYDLETSAQVCQKCGHQTDLLSVPDRFCQSCGAPFTQAALNQEGRSLEES